jgi:hypothetical protein
VFTVKSLVVLFDKAGVVRYQPLDQNSLSAEVLERARHLERQLEVYPTFVRKEIERECFLEALGSYLRHVLEPLVEALRLKHSPTRRDFYLKHVSRDLPVEVVAELERLYRVQDLSDVKLRLPEALELLQEALAGGQERTAFPESSCSQRGRKGSARMDRPAIVSGRGDVEG